MSDLSNKAEPLSSAADRLTLSGIQRAQKQAQKHSNCPLSAGERKAE